MNSVNMVWLCSEVAIYVATYVQPIQRSCTWKPGNLGVAYYVSDTNSS